MKEAKYKAGDCVIIDPPELGEPTAEGIITKVEEDAGFPLYYVDVEGDEYGNAGELLFRQIDLHDPEE